ncbi:MAG TPA: hydroxymethylglutaryl-CoA reductase, degradative [Anaerolineae bacterium]|nr:hydroxymethylglutaryl-CoA reductase, degradative [Anaerolineae bacterium]HIQ05306.1 hydroxymethylglutaryl-CoA reductase, degradative [Anaerolineae bacterium]
MTRSSRISGFYKLSVEERLRFVADWAGLNEGEIALLRQGLTTTQGDKMIENVVGTYALPLGIAVNFLINGRDYLVPMVIEEPSVVAGASFAARLVRAGGGFQTESSEPQMIGQMQVLELTDLGAARAAVLSQKQRLLDLANQTDPVVVSLHGGARDVEARIIPKSPVGPMLVVHLIYDCRDAMGANMVNTACEALAPVVEEITGGRVNLRILSNLADRRLARARCVIPPHALAFGDFPGPQVVDRIVEAYALAAVDPYRAATHNKGIMNGVDAVVIATGNDWRAIEAGAHTYAARDGQYRSLSIWEKDEQGNLVGGLEMPLAVGTVGGATRVHPTARLALKILGVQNARELAEVIAAVGLAQNLAAIRALATEGIQRGHMELHARQVAIAAGATGDEIEAIAAQLVAERVIRVDRAQELLEQSRRNPQKPS